MQKYVLSLCLFLLVASQATAADQPNILVVLADDLGYSDLGCYGGEEGIRNSGQKYGWAKT